MKKFGLILFVFLLTIIAYSEQRVKETIVTEVPKNELGAERFNPAMGFCRGIVNVLTCWLELPRETVYQTTKLPPVIGTLAGLGMGTVMTVYRCGIGVLDMATFGLTDSFFYEYPVFPNYVWEADWIAK